MQNSSGRLWFTAGLDTSEFMKAAEALKKELNNIAYVAESQSKRMRDAMVIAGVGSGKFSESINAASGDVKDLAKSVTQSGNNMESIFGRLAKAAAGFAGAFSAQAIVSSIVRVRGEFQQLEKSFLTMTGSAEETEMIMSQLADTAARTPFGLTELSQAATRLMAYGLETEKVNETLIRLGDIAAGLRIPINDLAYLYGTTMVQGRLYTEDFNQFVGRGIPIIGELAKQFGVAESAVKGLVEEGKVGFPEIEKAIISLTSAGGRFGGLMESQSQTITGQISNLQDSLDMMFNELGQKSEGLISGAISTVSTLVENYEKVGKAIAELVAAYGTYRAALMVMNAAQKANTAIMQQAVLNMKLAAAAGQNLTKAQAVATARTKLLQAAMASLNKTLMVNPYVAAAAAIAALGFGIYKLVTYQTDAEKAQERLNEAISEFRESADTEIAVLGVMFSRLNKAKKGTDEYRAAKEAIVEKYGGYLSGMDNEIRLLEDTTAAQKALTEAILETATARAHADFIQEASQTAVSEQLNALDKIKKRLIIEKGEEIGSALYSQVKAILDEAKANPYDENGERYSRFAQLMRDNGLDKFVGYGKDLTEAYTNFVESVKQFNEAVVDADENFGNTATSAENDGNIILPKDFDTQVEEAKVAVEKAKKTLADLMAGIIPEDADKNFDFASAIQAAEKEYKAAQERYNTLTGSDPKAIQKAASDRRKAEEDAARELADVNERIANEEYELQRKNTDDKLELIRMEKEQALKTLQDELTAAKAVYEKIGLPTDELEAQYQKLADLTAKSYDSDMAKEIQSQFDAVLKEVETYEQARLRIQEEYAEKRKMLMNEDGTLKDGVTQGNLDELTRQEQEAIDAISVTFAMRDEAFEQWSKSLAGKTADALELLLAEAEEELSILEDTAGADPEDVAKATAAIDKLKEALANANKENKDSEVTWADLNGVLQDSASIFTELGEKIPGVAGEILSGIGNIATSAVSMANAIKGIGEAASAAEKASAILAVISTAIKVLSFVTDTINENKEANEAATQAAWEYAEALEQIQINSRLEKYDTIFGENAFGKMLEQADIAKDAIKSIQDIYAKGTETTWLSSTGRINKDSMEGSNAMYRFTASKEMKELLKLNDELGNMSLVSDMRSGWQKFWDTGHQNVHIASLNDFLDEDGILDPDKLQEWYNAYGEGMTDENKRIVESLIQDGQILQDAMDGIAEYARSLFGDVSSSVADSMITAFEETGDAANATFDEISQNIARNFAKNAIMDILSREIFTPEAEETMSKLIATDSEGALEYFDSLMGKLQEVAPEIAEILNGIYGKYANSAETDETDHDRTSSAKGIAQASQDSVDELNGRATVIQSHTFSISNDMKTLVNTSAMMLDRLAGIESNTAHLEMIDNNIASLNKEMGNLRSDLTMRGIKLAR